MIILQAKTLTAVGALLAGFAASHASAQAVLFEDLGADFVPANGAQAGNALGDIVGYRLSTDQAAIRKNDGTLIDLGSLGGPQSRGNAIDATGEVAVGWSDNGNGSQNSFRFAEGTIASIFGVQSVDNQAVGIAQLGDIIANLQTNSGNDIFRWKSSDASFSAVLIDAQASSGVNNQGSIAGQTSLNVGFHLSSSGTQTPVSPPGFAPIGGVNDSDLVAGNITNSFAAFYFLGAPSAQAVPNISSLGSTSTATGVTDSDLIFGNTNQTVFLFDFFEDLLLDLNTVPLIGATDVDRLVSIHGVAKGADIFFGEYLTNDAETRYFKGIVTFGPGLDGDFDGNGQVDAADYHLWEQTYGGSGVEPFLDADGNQDGLVNAADYTVWRDSLGLTGTNAVPEPSAVLLALSAMIGETRRCRHG